MIGVFDSGIGGLSVLKSLRAALPQQDFIYIADSAHAPYGERTDDHVLQRTQAIGAWLVAQQIEALVVACNTATAAAVHLLRAGFADLPIVGLEPALKPAAARSQTGRIGVMATRSTLSSAKFHALHTALANEADFTLQACDGLAAAIERGGSSAAADDDIHALCARHVSAMGRFGQGPGEIDTLVLGCTHYPLVADVLGALVGPAVALMDTGEAVARQTARLLAARPASAADNNGAEAAPGDGQVTLLTTGDPGLLTQAAARWLGLSVVASRIDV
ncbi:MAG: glutamate racemase [Polaromonas sp.]|nr:glutamate racemase [Polaromonas sp.]